MARGFESKDVEFQQAEADRSAAAPRRTLTPAERAADEDRRSLQLTITRVRRELAAATSDTHRRMLSQAVEELERQLAAAAHITG